MSESFNITPPSIHLAEGPAIWFVGFCDEDIEKLSRGFDAFLENGATYYHSNDSINEETLGWARAISTMCSSIIVNVDTCTAEEVFMVLKSKELTNPTLFWVGELNLNEMLKRLICSYTDTAEAVESIDQLFEIMNAMFEEEMQKY